MNAPTFAVRPARPADEPARHRICLLTGDSGHDGTALYPDDPDALGRLYAAPYLHLEPALAFVLADADDTACGYALGALDSRAYYARYEAAWRPALCARFPAPVGDPGAWTRTQQIYHAYHHPDYFCPAPEAEFPSHAHIDLLPAAQGRGWGRRLFTHLLDTLRRLGSPGVHVGVSSLNPHALGFYAHLGFRELTRTGPAHDGVVYLGLRLAPAP